MSWNGDFTISIDSVFGWGCGVRKGGGETGLDIVSSTFFLWSASVLSDSSLSSRFLFRVDSVPGSILRISVNNLSLEIDRYNIVIP